MFTLHSWVSFITWNDKMYKFINVIKDKKYNTIGKVQKSNRKTGKNRGKVDTYDTHIYMTAFKAGPGWLNELGSWIT